MDFQTEKRLVRAYHDNLDAANADEAATVLRQYTTPNWHWRGMHPINERFGADAVAEAFWKPVKTSFSRLKRRADIFAAGRNDVDGFQSVWVVSMGHLMGLFDRPWLGIRPTQRIAMLRYAEFNRLENGKITETAMFFDVLSLMMQAGQYPLPPQTGVHLVQPGPATHDGLMYSPQAPETGEETLRLINAMVNNINTRPRDQTFDGKIQELQETWDDDMIWWGPTGIGATYTIPRYLQQHSDPFRQAFAATRTFNGHVCRIAEGHFGGFFGWANLTMINEGGYLGMTAGANAADMRVVDIYRAGGGKLVENWVFIDLLHFLKMQGLDVLERMEALQNYDIRGLEDST
ncbi:MAG: nuclear transport factor 2 family protein [Pseudomonadota bacterium]